MPNKTLISLAKKANISISKAEEYWAKAKEIAKNEFDLTDDESKWSNKVWAYVTGITKKMMNIGESNTIKSFKEYLDDNLY